MTNRLTPLALAALLLMGAGLAGAQSPAMPDPAVAPATAGAPAPVSRPTLSTVVADMLQADPQVRVARGQAEIAETRTRQARSRLWPTFGVTGTAGQSTDQEANADVQRSTERVEALLRWNLYNGGADRREVDATGLEWESARIEYDRSRGEVAERIADAWIEAQRTQAVAAASRRRLHEVALLTNQVVVQGQAGRLSEADVLQATSALAESQTSHEQAIAESEAARARLEVLTGRPLLGLEPVGFPVLNVPDALAHPAVRAARVRAEAASTRVRGLAETLSPRLDVELRNRIVDRTNPAPTTALKQGATVVLAWEMPLGGETLARRDEAARRAEAARAETDRIELQLRAELAALRERERPALDAVERTRGQVDQARALMRAARVQYEAGRRSVQQLVQTRESQFLAEQRLAEAQARLHQLRMRQWATAGALLPVLGIEPGVTTVSQVPPPLMDAGEAPTASAPRPATPPIVAASATEPPAAAAPAMVAATPVTAPAPSSAKSTDDGTAAARASLDRWLAAWRARDLPAYLDSYATTFEPPRGLTRAQWEAQRRRILGQGSGPLEITLGEARITPQGDGLRMQFRQRYRSASFADEVDKTLDWVREGGRWRIVRETVR